MTGTSFAASTQSRGSAAGTTDMIDVQPPPRHLATVALLAFALCACSAPGAARRAPAAARPTVVPASAPSSAAAPPATAPAQSEALEAREEARPLLLVLPSGDAYLVLGSAPSRRDDGVSWDVVYHAGGNPAALEDPVDRERRASAARELLGAFRLLAEVAQTRRLSVTAVLGRPGERGVAEQHRFERAAGQWRPDGPPSWLGVERVPPIDPDAVRDRDAEDRAREAAGAFVSDAGRGDYDAAWARTSPLAKAVMSRAEFERRLAQTDAARAPDPTPYLAFPVPAGPFLPGVFVEAWITRETPRDASVETLTMRLDDDMEWRVAGAAKVTRARPPAAQAGDGGEAELPSARSAGASVGPDPAW
jgi:hypothetical protein